MQNNLQKYTDSTDHNVMLAVKMDRKFDRRGGPWIVEPKRDGIRCTVKVENGKVEYLSREGNNFKFLAMRFNEEIKNIEDRLGFPFVLDGELFAGSFEKTLSAISEKGDKSILFFYAFALVSLIDWEKKTPCHYYWHEALSDMLRHYLCSCPYETIKPTGGIMCENYKDIRQEYKERLKDGYEGVVIKCRASFYHQYRSREWTKWKPAINVI